MKLLIPFSLLVLTAATGCSRPSSPQPSDARAPKSCRKADPAPELTAPPELEKVESHLTLEASVTEDRLRKEIARELPVNLDAGQRTVGPGVRVTYAVKRGDLDFGLANGRFEVRVPIMASASACKTIGPLCPVLGRCNPRLDVRVSVPTVLEEDYSYRPSQVNVNLVRGCNIAGFDASGEIASRAAAEAKQAERDLERQMPPVRPYAKAGWEALHQTLEVSDKACLRVVPRTVSQAHPQQAGEVISMAASVGGELFIDPSCSGKEPPPIRDLPPLKVVDEVPEGIRLRAPLRIAWTDVAAALHDSLANQVAIKRLAVQGAAVQDAARLVIELEREDDPCGPVWLVAQPLFDASTSTLRLGGVTLYPEWDPKRKLGDLTEQLEEYARIPLPIELDELRRKLARAREQYLPRIDEERVTVDIELGAPEVERVALDAEGVVPIVVVSGEARISGE